MPDISPAAWLSFPQPTGEKGGGTEGAPQNTQCAPGKANKSQGRKDVGYSLRWTELERQGMTDRGTESDWVKEITEPSEKSG